MMFLSKKDKMIKWQSQYLQVLTFQIIHNINFRV